MSPASSLRLLKDNFYLLQLSDVQNQLIRSDLDRQSLHHELNMTRSNKNWLVRELAVLRDNIQEKLDNDQISEDQDIDGIQSHVEYMLKSSESDQLPTIQSEEEASYALTNRMMAIKLEKLSRENQKLHRKLSDYQGDSRNEFDLDQESQDKLLAESYRKLRSEIDFNSASELLAYVKDSLEEISRLQDKNRRLEVELEEMKVVLNSYRRNEYELENGRNVLEDFGKLAVERDILQRELQCLLLTSGKADIDPVLFKADESKLTSDLSAFQMSGALKDELWEKIQEL